MEAEHEKKTENLEEIIVKFYPQISFRVKKSIGHLNPEWEDICSDILISVIEAIKTGKFRGESSIGTFIYSITSKKIIDYIRKKTRVLKHLPEPKISSDPHESLEHKQKQDKILEAIKKLKPKHADMVYLHYYIGLSYREIAQIFSLSPRWVSEIIKSSRKSLKRIIDW